jgi:hypothetical protein
MSYFFVMRDMGSDNAEYWISENEDNMRLSRSRLSVKGALGFFCKEEWERLTGIRLKPGEGPIKVKIERV